MDTEDRLLQYETAIQDIRDLKANQWRFSHYGLLIQAAIVAVDSRAEAPQSYTWEVALLGLSVLTCGLIILLIHEAQGNVFIWRRATKSLQEPRKETVTEWLKEFGTKTQNVRRRPWKGRDWKFMALFFGGQIIGAALAVSLIWSGQSTSAC